MSPRVELGLYFKPKELSIDNGITEQKEKSLEGGERS